jgi:hypothetical protein
MRRRAARGERSQKFVADGLEDDTAIGLDDSANNLIGDAEGLIPSPPEICPTDP